MLYTLSIMLIEGRFSVSYIYMQVLRYVSRRRISGSRSSTMSMSLFMSILYGAKLAIVVRFTFSFLMTREPSANVR